MGYLGVGKMVLTKKICAIKTLKVRRLAIKSKEKREKKQKRVFAKSHTNRTYALAVFTGFKRGKRNQFMNISLLKIKGSSTIDDAKFYVGKTCAFVYKPAPKRPKKMPEPNVKKVAKKYRVIWGKVTRTHGNSGMVRARFRKNLPAQAMGLRVRIMMYPSRI